MDNFTELGGSVKKMDHFADFGQIKNLGHFLQTLGKSRLRVTFADSGQVKIICIIKNYRTLLIYFGLQNYIILCLIKTTNTLTIFYTPF